MSRWLPLPGKKVAMKQTMKEWLIESKHDLSDGRCGSVWNEIARRIDELTEKVETNTAVCMAMTKDNPGENPMGVLVKVGMRVIRKSDGVACTVAPKADGWKMLRVYHDDGGMGAALFSEYTCGGMEIIGYYPER